MVRAPSWAAGIMAALPPALFILEADQLEGRIGMAMGIEGGPEPLAVMVLLFVLAWALMIPFLMRADDPGRAGLWAGVWIETLIMVILLSIVEFFFIVLILWILFGGLAIGLGVLAGGIARRLDSGQGSRTLGMATIAVGIIIFMASLPFLPGIGVPMLATPMVATLLVTVALFVGGGAWLMRS